MLKLINAYRTNPSDMNALKVAHHAKIHPMSVTFLSVEECALLAKARTQLAPFVAKLDAIVIGEFI
jgi:hypothetical protein